MTMTTPSVTPMRVRKHAKALDFFSATPKEGASESDVQDFIRDADAYFDTFAAPEKDKHGELICLKCGEQLTGFHAMLLGKGGFEWGLAHGEGHCRNCGWPARAYHSAKKATGEDLFTVRNLILQYHPDFVETRKHHEPASEQERTP